MYFIILSVKQGGIKYFFFFFFFLRLWYDSTWDWTPVSRPIGKYNYLLFNYSQVVWTLFAMIVLSFWPPTLAHSVGTHFSWPCSLVHGLSLRWPPPQALTLLRWGLVYHLMLELPVFRVIQTGLEVFLEPSGACGLWSWAWYPQKMILCQTCMYVGVFDKYQFQPYIIVRRKTSFVNIFLNVLIDMSQKKQWKSNVLYSFIYWMRIILGYSSILNRPFYDLCMSWPPDVKIYMWEAFVRCGFAQSPGAVEYTDCFSAED